MSAKKPITKDEIRLAVKKMRADRSEEQINSMSTDIANRILCKREYKDADTVFVYLDLPGEVKTALMIEAAWLAGKKVAVPKVCGSEMKFYYIESFDGLKQSGFGVFEPEHGILAEDKAPLIIMPGVAFDEQRHRIGYGGGFYDKFLEDRKDAHTIALAFEFQIFESIASEGFDIRPDCIITEKREI